MIYYRSSETFIISLWLFYLNSTTTEFQYYHPQPLSRYRCVDKNRCYDFRGYVSQMIMKKENSRTFMFMGLDTSDSF